MESASHDKRIFPRKSINADGELTDPVSGGSSSIVLLDISLGGISFLSPIPFMKNSVWRSRLLMPSGIAHGSVRLIYCVKHSLTDAYRVGAELKGWDERSMTLIRRYLDERPEATEQAPMESTGAIPPSM